MMIAIHQPEAVDDRKLRELSRLNPGYRFERGAAGELIVSPSGGESARRVPEMPGFELESAPIFDPTS
jgi:hypothetical protein